MSPATEGRKIFTAEVIIAVFQAVIILFLVDIRGAIVKHEARLDEMEKLVPQAVASMQEHGDFREKIGALEAFAAKGDRWSAEQQRQHEEDMAERLQRIWSAVDKLASRVNGHVENR